MKRPFWQNEAKFSRLDSISSGKVERGERKRTAAEVSKAD